MSSLKEYFGDKSYNKKVLKVAVPLALTMLLQSCMSIVDTIMVSKIGMVTAVGNAGNIIQLKDGVNWGIIGGISIFAAQFYGAGQKENMARTFGLVLILEFANALIWICSVYFAGEKILFFYLNDPAIVKYSLIYIRVAILALIPDAICFSCSVLYRSQHNTKLPFILSIIATISNITLNYTFIYVLNMGVVGAAWGTLLASSLNALIYISIILYSKPDFLIPNKMFDIRVGFLKPVLKTMLPLIINETFFGLGMSLFNKAYGMLGTKAMDAVYVANQVFNMFTFVIWGYGNAISVIVGSTLGKGKLEQAKIESRYQLGCSIIIGLSLSILMAAFAKVYLRFFNIVDPITYRNAELILYAFAFKVFLRTMTYMLFSTLKAGGDSKILNLYDSGFMYLIGLPLAFICALAGMKSIGLLILIVQLEQVVRLIFTLRRFNSYIWVKDLTKLVKV